MFKEYYYLVNTLLYYYLEKMFYIYNPLPEKGGLLKVIRLCPKTLDINYISLTSQL
jgi:hypothetical protein